MSESAPLIPPHPAELKSREDAVLARAHAIKVPLPLTAASVRRAAAHRSECTARLVCSASARKDQKRSPQPMRQSRRQRGCCRTGTLCYRRPSGCGGTWRRSACGRKRSPFSSRTRLRRGASSCGPCQQYHRATLTASGPLLSGAPPVTSALALQAWRRRVACKSRSRLAICSVGAERRTGTSAGPEGALCFEAVAQQTWTPQAHNRRPGHQVPTCSSCSAVTCHAQCLRSTSERVYKSPDRACYADTMDRALVWAEPFGVTYPHSKQWYQTQSTP